MLSTEICPLNPNPAPMPDTSIERLEWDSEQLKRLRLFRLCSPMLPIGSFTWSQGLETAVERGWIHDPASAQDWVKASLLQSIAQTEGPLLLRLARALQEGDPAAFSQWNEMTLALRETRELYLEDKEQGELLQRLNRLHHPTYSHKPGVLSLPAAFAEALNASGIEPEDGLLAFLWMWVETQVTQLIKLMPLGLRDGQLLLDHLLFNIPLAHQLSRDCADDAIGLSLPGRALASCFHESQYCRIYRS